VVLAAAFTGFASSRPSIRTLPSQYFTPTALWVTSSWSATVGVSRKSNPSDGTRTVQRVLASLGRVEELEANGKLDALLRSGARFSETAMVISSLQAGTLESSASVRIGAAMVFGRLWEQTGCHKVVEQLAAGRGFGFPVERAVLASVLHRLVVSGSDRACDKWLDAYQIDGAAGLELHQLYRAMAWLGVMLIATGVGIFIKKHLVDIGPLTVAMLIHNTVRAAQMRRVERRVGRDHLLRGQSRGHPRPQTLHSSRAQLCFSAMKADAGGKGAQAEPSFDSRLLHHHQSSGRGRQLSLLVGT